MADQRPSNPEIASAAGVWRPASAWPASRPWTSARLGAIPPRQAETSLTASGVTENEDMASWSDSVADRATDRRCGSDHPWASQPARRAPGALPEQAKRGRKQHAAHDRRVKEDRGGQSHAHLLELDHRQGAEDGEHPDHDQGRARHRSGGAAHAVDDRRAGIDPLEYRFTHAREDEHVIVHREPEEDDEEKQRQP